MWKKIIFTERDRRSAGAPPEVVVPAAIFPFVVMIGLVLGLRGRTRILEHHGLEAEARRWIGDRIDEYVNVLAKA